MDSLKNYITASNMHRLWLKAKNNDRRPEKQKVCCDTEKKQNLTQKPDY